MFRLLAYGEGATQQRSCVRRQDARRPRTLKASDALRTALTVLGAALSARAHLHTFLTGKVAEAVVSVGLSPETTAGAGLVS